MKQFHLFADKNGVTGKKVCKQMRISFGFPFLFVSFRYREERGYVASPIKIKKRRFYTVKIAGKRKHK